MKIIRSIYILIVFFLIPYVATSQIITAFAGIAGSPGYSGDWGPATAAKLRVPSSVVVDTAGNIYICDAASNVVRKVNVAGIIRTYAGNGIMGHTGDNGPATDAQIRCQAGMAIDKYGNIYFAEPEFNFVRKIDAATGIITTFAGNGSLPVSGDGGPATAAGLGSPSAVCADTAGNIYIAGSNRIRKVNTMGIITKIAGTGAAGHSGDGGLADTAKIISGGWLTTDISENIYFGEGGPGTIRKISTSGIISTIGGTGVSGYSGDFGAATAAQFYNPSGLHVDSCGNIYISDRFNHVIRIISAANGYVYTIAGTHTPVNSGDGGLASAAGFYSPADVSMDKYNNLYICVLDYVRKVTMPRCADIVFPTSLQELQSKETGISIFPNPASGAFSVKVNTGSIELVRIAIMTTTGALAEEYTILAGMETPLHTHLPPSVYMVVAESNKQRWVSKVVVR